MEQGDARLAAGVSVVIFPQHTRSVDFDPEQFNSIVVRFRRNNFFGDLSQQELKCLTGRTKRHHRFWNSLKLLIQVLQLRHAFDNSPVGR